MEELVKGVLKEEGGTQPPSGVPSLPLPIVADTPHPTRKGTMVSMESHPKPSLPLLGPEVWIAQAEDDNGGEELHKPFTVFPPITRGRVTLLGGATETGKTLLGLQWFKEVLDKEYTGAYITLEMTPADLFRRFAPQFPTDDVCKEWIREKNAFVSESYANISEVESIVKN